MGSECNRSRGALARPAHVALETGGRAPWLEVGRVAMTTRRRRREPRLDQSDNLLARARRRQRLDKCFTLNLAEIAQLFDNGLKIRSLHDILAGDKPTVTNVAQHQGGTEPKKLMK